MKTTLITKSTTPSSLSGFTLAELMVTVAILGILLAVAIPIFSTSINSQRVKDCSFNRKIIMSAINRAAAISGKNLADINTAIDGAETSVETLLNRYIRGGSLENLECNVGGSITRYTILNGEIVHNH